MNEQVPYACIRLTGTRKSLLGHLRRGHGDGMSAIAPIATELLREATDERCQNGTFMPIVWFASCATMPLVTAVRGHRMAPADRGAHPLFVKQGLPV